MWMMHLVFHLVPKFWGIWGNVLIWRVSWFLGNFMEHFLFYLVRGLNVWTCHKGTVASDDEPLVIEAQLFVASVSCWLLSEVEKLCPEHIMLMISFSRFWSFLKESGGGGCGDDQFRLARFVSCCCCCCLSVWRAGGLCLEFAEQVRIVSCNLVLFLRAVEDSGLCNLPSLLRRWGRIS
jgi:hypothetical protein